ncbi:LysR family transcriptional regulator [Fangia hongkongensis]|uniref:LysR family transcriptional regulator n=2 Tax=Fangia hongkongensis TaxID=270495 RepID=UPI0003783D71|nr:LysR family transcriptional regulator [Fangia hongkongensis]
MKNIRAFLAVVDTGSFTEAANQLFLTQPTITKRISQLEYQMHNSLFNRLGSHIELTDAGKALLPYARRMVNEWNNAQNTMQMFNTEVIGDLALDCNYSLGLHFLPMVLKTLNAEHPKVNLKINFDYTLPIIDNILDYKSELGLITVNDNIPDDIVTHKILKQKVIPVISSNHPFWRSKEDIHTKLQSIPVISPEAGNQHHTELHKLINHFSIQSPEISGVNMLEIIVSMVEKGIGWALISENMLNDKLKRIPLKMKETFIENACIYRKGVTLSKPAKVFLQLCQNATKQS